MNTNKPKRLKKITTTLKRFDRSQIPISELMKVCQSFDLTKYNTLHFDAYNRTIVGMHYQTPEDVERERQELLLKKQRAEEKRRALELRKIEEDKKRKVAQYQKLKTQLATLETELQSL